VHSHTTKQERKQSMTDEVKAPETEKTETPEVTVVASDPVAARLASKNKKTAERAEAEKTEAEKIPPLDLKDKNVEQLLTLFNEMVLTATDLGIRGESTRGMFVDIQRGREACEALHAKITKKRQASAAKAAREMEKDMAKKARAAAKAAKKTAKKPTKKTAKKRGAHSGGGARTKFAEDAKIKLLIKENNRRKGTGAHKRFQVLLDCDGTTVKNYLSKSNARVATLARAVRRREVSVG
jgi:hypothetical protein